MSISGSVARWGSVRISRRLARSVPFFGAIIAIAALGSAVRRKGVMGGAMDTGLNAMPFVGALKTAVEVMRGRDIFPDRGPRAMA
jgi:hypothetical protein